MRKIVRSLPVLVMLMAGITSCKKNSNNPVADQQAKKDVDPALVYKKPTTAAELLLVKNLGSVSAILQEMYKNNDNLKVVNAAILAKVYTDQSVLIRDLVYPDLGIVKSNKKFQEYCQQWKVDIKTFAADFAREVAKKNDPELRAFLQVMGESRDAARTSNEAGRRVNFYNENQVPQEASLYFPYAEQFPPDGGGGTYMPVTSVVTATADADQGWGVQPYFDTYGNMHYLQVVIDDDYAYNNPTQVVGVNGIEPTPAPPQVASVFPPTGPIQVGLPREVKQVYVGDVRINGHQYDKLISFTGNGGGSEIVFTRADGFLKVVDGQVQADVFSNGKTISRGDIRNHRMVDFSTEWDPDWESTNLQENLAIFEEDNRNSSEFSASISTTLKLSDMVTLTVGPIGFKITFKSDDWIIKQTNYNRDVFFSLNRINLEGEMYNGWPVRDRGGDVSFTLNDRTLF